ncbi:MAG: hypothetical protein WC879_08375 [Melioribacteraceae bacterium]
MNNRNRNSIIIGIIIAALLRKFLFNSAMNFTSIDKEAVRGIIEFMFNVFTNLMMILTVYLLYPLFVKNKID